MKLSKSILAIATMSVSAVTFAGPYPYHAGNYSYNSSDDDVVTTTVTKTKSDYRSDDDVITSTNNYSYSDDDVKTITKSDDDITKISSDYRSSWESNYTSNWSNQEDHLNSSATANDYVHQDSGHKAKAAVSGEATGHSNATRGATMFMNFGGLGNPVSNSGVYIDNTDNNSNQFGINSSQSSVQTGGDLGDRIISLSGVGNTDGSANGSVGTYGSNDIGQYGSTSLDNQKSVSSAVSK